MLPTAFCLRSSAVFAFMPSIPSFLAVPRASRIQRGFAHLANDPSAAGEIAGVHVEAKAAPSPVQRIQGTGGLRQLPKVEPVNELVSRARNRVRALHLPFSFFPPVAIATCSILTLANSKQISRLQITTQI